MSIVGTSGLLGQPEMVGGIGGSAGPERRSRLQHQVERLGADAAVGVQQHDDARAENGAVMI